jgi:hypothetical protein
VGVKNQSKVVPGSSLPVSRVMGSLTGFSLGITRLPDMSAHFWSNRAMRLHTSTLASHIPRS